MFKELNKRGDFMFQVIAYLFIGVSIGFIIFFTMAQLSTGQADANKRHAKEIQHAIEAISLTQNNVIVKYPYALDDTSVIVEKNKIKISQIPNDPTAGTATIVVSENQYLNEKFYSPENMYIANLGNHLTVQESAISLLNQDCPSFPLEVKDWRNEKIQVAALNQESEEFLNLISQETDFSKVFTSKNDFPLFHLSFETTEGHEFIKIYYDLTTETERGRKIACLLHNDLAKENLQLASIPFNPLATTPSISTLLPTQEVAHIHVHIQNEDLTKASVIFTESLQRTLYSYYRPGTNV